MDGNNFENTNYDAGAVENTAYDTTADAYNYDAYEEGVQPSESNGLALAAMIVGIASVVLTFLLGCCLGGIGTIVTIISSIVGLVLSLKAKKNGQKKGFWLAGIICSAVALAISAIWTIIAIGTLIAVLFGAAAEYSSY